MIKNKATAFKREYMDDIKGYYYSDDYEQKKAEKSYKELLDERAVYSTEVHFE